MMCTQRSDRRDIYVRFILSVPEGLTVVVLYSNKTQKSQK